MCFFKEGCRQLAYLHRFLPIVVFSLQAHVQHRRKGFQTVVPSGGLPRNTGGAGRGVLVSQLTRCFLDVLHVLGVTAAPASKVKSTTLRHLAKECQWRSLFQKRIICSDSSHSRSSKGAADVFKPPTGETRHVQMFWKKDSGLGFFFLLQTSRGTVH